MPGKRWKDGVAGWEKDMALIYSRLQEGLNDPPIVSGKEINIILSDMSYSSNRFHLALFEWWLGNEAAARELFSMAATHTEKVLQRWLPTRPPSHYSSYAEFAQHGAMAASIVGMQPLAHKLFAQAELLATGLLSDDSTPPDNYLNAVDHIGNVRPYTRIYNLLRLGRLSGFHAFIYTVPLEQARRAAPVWKLTDVHEALEAANFCWELWRRERRGLDWLKQKKFEPLLRALIACLSPGAGEAEHATARRALQAYQDSIHDLHYFKIIYPFVLDLRAAWPHIFA